MFDISNAQLPLEIAFFVSSSPSRAGGLLPQTKFVAQTEDVHVDARRYIYISDKNAGSVSCA